VRIGLACGPAPPSAELLDLLEAAGLPATSLRGAPPPALLTVADTTWLLASGADVLRACDRAAVDLGVVGKHVLLESRHGVSELLDLGCCRDALVYADAAGARPGRALRVATSHPVSARAHFAATGRQVVIVAMDEPALALGLGLADGVVMLRSRLAARVPGVDGALEIREEVAACSARLVAGRAGRALLGARLGDLLERLRAVVEGA